MNNQGIKYINIIDKENNSLLICLGLPNKIIIKDLENIIKTAFVIYIGHLTSIKDLNLNISESKEFFMNTLKKTKTLIAFYNAMKGTIYDIDNAYDEKFKLDISEIQPDINDIIPDNVEDLFK